MFLIAAAWVQVSVGLLPLQKLRTGLEAVRLGRVRRLNPHVPSELHPLVGEINRLLDAQETELERARARAADLAHGLRTPLTALSVMAQELRGGGQLELANDMEHHLRGLEQHVERELTRSRIAAGAQINRRTSLSGTMSGLVKTLCKLPGSDAIDWRIDCTDDLVAAVEETDLAEILGNLMDNARKWAHSVIAIAARHCGREIEILVEDDGVGIPMGDRSRVLNRGIRLDERVSGTGLGLTIANEIVEAYNGRLELGSSQLGGLRLSVILPSHGGTN
jgi:signal transduction histidine kinase